MEAAAIALSGSTAGIRRDGTSSSTITATVSDADGNEVPDGTDVVWTLAGGGSLNPAGGETFDGIASTIATPMAGGTSPYLTVTCKVGAVSTAIRIDLVA